MKYAILFTKQLAAMLRGGLPLQKSLNQLAEVFPDKRYKLAARQIARGLDQGYGLAHLLRGHHRMFPPFYTALVEIGEYGDSLLPALDTLAHYYGEREMIKGRLVRIIFYPLLLLAAAFASGLFALWHVVPTFAALYSALGSEIPPATARVFAVARLLTPARLFTAVMIAGLGLGSVYILAVNRIRWRTLAKIPLAGTIACYWFCRVTAMIVGAGHTLEQSLLMAAELSRRGPAPGALAEIRKGKSLFAALEGSPGVLRSFIGQGEATGELPQALERAAEYYRLQVEEAMDNFQRLLEPGAVLFVGGLVAAMLLILMTPMLQIARTF